MQIDEAAYEEGLKKGPEGETFRALCNANLLASTI